MPCRVCTPLSAHHHHASCCKVVAPPRRRPTARRLIPCASRLHTASEASPARATQLTAGLLASWRKGDDCCHWRGVRCSNRTGHAHGHVVALNLRGQGLPGEISPSLRSLPHLEHLGLSDNSLITGCISGFLGSLENLRYLNLSYLYFSPGEVPPHLDNLSKLHSLDLSKSFYYENIFFLQGSLMVNTSTVSKVSQPGLRSPEHAS